MTDHYHGYAHPVLRDLPEEAPSDFFTEMDAIADELRVNPEHVPGDDQIAFRQLQKLRRPDLTKEQWLDLFAVWRDRYEAREAAKAAQAPALYAELDALFTKRAALPPPERAAVTARIEAIARKIADIAVVNKLTR